jgi:type VI protein secretion system component Hcp
MSNSLAEAYLLIVRESNVPVIGEAVPIPFTGQIELDAWSWEIKNLRWEAKEKARLEREANNPSGKEGTGGKGTTERTGTAKTGANDNAALFKPDGLIRQVSDMQVHPRLTQKERDKRVQELIKKAVAGYAEAAANSGEDKDKDKDGSEGKGMVLTFDKAVDLSTTSLLYALAYGEILPRAVLTLFHRAKASPVSLAITMGDIRLESCDISCDPDDKMADIKEKWKATYQTISWVYQNRPSAAGLGAGTNLAQGQVRVFTMDSPLPI